MLVSHSHRFIFIKTRKTGGTSTQIALSKLMDHPDDIVAPTRGALDEARELGGGQAKNTAIHWRRWRAQDWYWAVRGRPRRYTEHMRATHVRHHLGHDIWNSYFSFAVDRNPWDQVVSRYFYYFRPERGRARIPFEEFVLEQSIDHLSNWPLYGDGDDAIVDKVIRYELLNEGLAEITDMLGLPKLELPRAKGGYRTDRRPYQDFYDERTRRRVAEVFSREIEYFGWTFD